MCGKWVISLFIVSFVGLEIWFLNFDRLINTEPLFFDIGIEFINIAAEDQQRLQRIVDRLVKNDA